MTAEAFMAAYRRFVSRRGIVRNLYSDNGTNFVKSNKILQENLTTSEEQYDTAVCWELAKAGTAWHFSPPGGPHFNGLAEAGVKSVRAHLRKTIADAKLTFEELSTLLSQIEACVNSLSSDPNDTGVLTPGHFLVGETLIAPPERSHLEAKASWLTRWQRVQQMSQHFWKRWQLDYLNQLQTRTKWFTAESSLEIDDLVLIRDENQPPTQWRTGRILEKHPGDDGHVRVVTLKTSDGQLKRPIAKLCAFPKDTADVATVEVKSNIIQAKKLKPISFLPILTAFMALCVTNCHTSPLARKPYEIIHFDTPPGFYFEKTHEVFMTHSDWSVLSHLNLQKLQHDFDTMRANLTAVTNSCFTNGLKSSGCRSVIAHLTERLNKIEIKNALIAGNHRMKRSAPTLHFIGDILGDFTGLVGSKFSTQYEMDLSEIHNNQEHLLMLLKNNTSVLDSTLDIIKRGEYEKQKQADRFNEFIATVQNHTDAFIIENMLHSFFECFSQSIDEYERELSAIIDVTTDARREHIDHELFTPSQIELQIEIISKQVGSDYLVPSAVDVYSVGKISVYRLKHQYIFKLSIPLLQTQRFKLYKIIAVPTVQSGKSLILKNNHGFLLASADRQLFQYVDEYKCIPYHNGLSLICDKPNQFFIASRSECVWNIFNHLPRDGCELAKFNDSVFFRDIRANTF